MSTKAITKEGKRRYFKKALALILVSAVFITSAFSVAAFSKTVDVIADGKTITVTTMSRDTYDILAKANVTLGSDDEAIYSEDNAKSTIEVLRAFDVKLNAHGEVSDLMFTRGTVADALASAGVEIYENDSVIPSVDEKLTPNMKITVDTMFTVSLDADGQIKTESVPSGTVKDALEFLGVTLGEDDVVSQSLDASVENGMEIKIDRVEYKDTKTTEEIKFDTVNTETDKLDKGDKEVKTEGENGEKEITVRQKLINGEVAEEEKISEEVVKEPTDEEILIGTYEKAEETEASEALSSATGAPAASGTSYSSDDLYCLTAVIWQEAGALYMSDDLQRAVASVVINQVNNPAYPNSIRACLLRAGAYGTMAYDGINLPNSSDAGTQQAIARCESNARYVLENGGTLPSNVIYQTNMTMGSGLCKVIDGVYFSYE